MTVQDVIYILEAMDPKSVVLGYEKVPGFDETVNTGRIVDKIDAVDGIVMLRTDPNSLVFYDK